MAQSKEPTHTLANIFYPMDDPRARDALEKFRVAYEQENPPPDIKKRYTSQWPADHQTWMKHNEPRRYWDTLPRFVKEWLKREVSKAVEVGHTAGIEPYLLKLHANNEMDIGEDGRGPERPRVGR